MKRNRAAAHIGAVGVQREPLAHAAADGSLLLSGGPDRWHRWLEATSRRCWWCSANFDLRYDKKAGATLLSVDPGAYDEATSTGGSAGPPGWGAGEVRERGADGELRRAGRRGRRRHLPGPVTAPSPTPRRSWRRGTRASSIGSRSARRRARWTPARGTDCVMALDKDLLDPAPVSVACRADGLRQSLWVSYLRSPTNGRRGRRDGLALRVRSRGPHQGAADHRPHARAGRRHGLRRADGPALRGGPLRRADGAALHPRPAGLHAPRDRMPDAAAPDRGSLPVGARRRAGRHRALQPATGPPEAGLHLGPHLRREVRPGHAVPPRVRRRRRAPGGGAEGGRIAASRAPASARWSRIGLGAGPVRVLPVRPGLGDLVVVPSSGDGTLQLFDDEIHAITRIVDDRREPPGRPRPGRVPFAHGGRATAAPTRWSTSPPSPTGRSASSACPWRLRRRPTWCGTRRAVSSPGNPCESGASDREPPDPMAPRGPGARRLRQEHRSAHGQDEGADRRRRLPRLRDRHLRCAAPPGGRLQHRR